MVILKATSFFKGHKNNKRVTSSYTLVVRMENVTRD